MMVAILNSAMLDSDTAILYSDTLLSSLRFTQKHSHSTLTLTQTNSIWLTRWWQPSWIQPFYKNLWFKLIQSDSNSFILTQLDDGCHLEFCLLGFCHCHLGFSHLSFYSHSHSHLPRLVDTICPKKTSLTLPSPPFAQKNFTHSFWLNLMMVAILNSAILDSDTAILDSDLLLSSLRFIQKLSHSTLTLTQTNSIWLTWWWQPSWIQPFCTKKTLLIHSHSTWWWQSSWILPSWIQPFCTKKLHSFILTQLNDGSHLELCHLGFRHLVIFSQIHSKTPSLHSDSDSN